MHSMLLRAETLLDVGREQKEFIIKSASIARLEPCNGLETCKGLSCFFGCHGSSYKTAVYIRCAPQRGRLYFKWMSQHLTQRQSLALCCREVIATEVSKASVSAAKYNLAANGMTNVHIARLSSEEFAQAWRGEREFVRLKDLPPVKDRKFQTILVRLPEAPKLMAPFCPPTSSRPCHSNALVLSLPPFRLAGIPVSEHRVGVDMGTSL